MTQIGTTLEGIAKARELTGKAFKAAKHQKPRAPAHSVKMKQIFDEAGISQADADAAFHELLREGVIYAAGYGGRGYAGTGYYAILAEPRGHE